MAERPAVYDHSRSAPDAGRATGESDPGRVTSESNPGHIVYRVVGIDDDRITLLRRIDAVGNRETAGELRYVSRAESDESLVAAARLNSRRVGMTGLRRRPRVLLRRRRRYLPPDLLTTDLRSSA